MARSGIPLCSEGDGGVSDRTSKHRQRSIPLYYWLVFLLLAAGGIYCTLSNNPDFVNPKIAAEPYVWPDGCKRKNYKYGDYISKSCMTPKYAIPEWKQYGWQAGMGTSTVFEGFYRVGNDAIAFHHCDSASKNLCKAREKIVDVFIVTGENK
jgi:hypothetical protein